MPYNTEPIVPSQDVKGALTLPLTRVKKIINVDPDIASCSTNAAFMITLATEMFLQHLVAQAHNQVKSEHASKPRKNLQYRDVANAVARVENLEFLSDVVPKVLTYKQAKQKLAKEASASLTAKEGGAGHQGTLDGHIAAGVNAAAPTPKVDIMDIVDKEQLDQDEEMS